MRFTIYLIVVMAALLPIVFRRVYWLRLVCVLLLGLLALLHYTFLMAEHRLVLERGYQHFSVSPGGKLPDDFRAAVSMVQDLSQGEMPLVFLLVVAFATLALLPFGQRKKIEDSHDA